MTIAHFRGGRKECGRLFRVLEPDVPKDWAKCQLAHPGQSTGGGVLVCFLGTLSFFLLMFLSTTKKGNFSFGTAILLVLRIGTQTF